MIVTKKPRRRWFQFSLRTLLVLVAVVGVCLALTVNSARKQREAVAAIEALGGTVRYEHERPSPQEPPGPEWLRELVGEEYFFTIVGVGLNGTQITDAGLEHLKGLKSLQYLGLNSTNVTDAGLERLKGLTSLQELYVGNTKVTDAGLEHLEGLTSLEGLSLSKTQVTDTGLEHLKGLSQLRYLHLQDTQVTDAGLEHLQGLKSLSQLGLGGTKVTAEGVKKLQKALPNCNIQGVRKLQ